MFNILNSIRLIDEKIKELNKKRQDAPSSLVNMKKELIEKEEKFNKKQKNVEEIKAKSHSLNISISDGKEKLKKAESKLTEVKNTKQYQAGLKEVASIKKTISDMEKEELANLEAEEKIAIEYQAAETDFNNVSKEYESELVKFKDTYNMVERDIKDLAEDRVVLIKSLTDDVAGKYNKIYKNTNGRAVALLNSGKCGTCHMMLPPQFCNLVLKEDTINLCPSCQRIIIHIS